MPLYDYKCDTCHRVYERNMPCGALKIVCMVCLHAGRLGTSALLNPTDKEKHAFV